MPRVVRLFGLLLAATLAAVARAELRRDLEYGAAGGEKLLLDVNVPDGAGPFPVAIVIHGGGWGSGDKSGSKNPGGGDDITPLFQPLTDAGCVWFSINYRLAPAHRWPACFDDVQTAIRWVKAHAAEFKGDPRRIALVGHSAGGHLACLAAVKAEEDTRVQAVVGFAPPTDLEQELPARGGLSLALQNLHGRPKEVTPEALEILRATSAITHVKTVLPAFLLVHGMADKSVPFVQSLNFQAKIHGTGGVCDIVKLEGAPHGLLKWTDFKPDWPAVVSAWLKRALNPEIVPLWPEGVPGLRADAAEEKTTNGRVTAIHYPTLTVYRPAPERATGAAVVFCPGGGYLRLAIGGLGGREVQFLNEQGVTVFLLKYRLAEYGHPAPLRDVLRAVRLVRSRAAEFGVRADRVGVLGQSAGAHLAGSAAEFWDSPEGKTGAELDIVSARPDFAALIYAVVTLEDPFAHKGSREGLLGKTPSPELVAALSLEKHVRKDMPPVFLAATSADKGVVVDNTLLLHAALRSAKVPAEMHIYADGSHGNSLDPQYGPTALWLERLAEWMKWNGWLTPAAGEKK